MDDNQFGVLPFEIERRFLVEAGATAAVLSTLPWAVRAGSPTDRDEQLPSAAVELRVNGRSYDLTHDPRTTLLDDQSLDSYCVQLGSNGEDR